MATHSFIGKKLDDGKVRFIYCHYDGDPKSNGRVLLNHYNLNNIDRLLDNGDLSVLGKRIDPISSEHSFSTPEDGTCVFYGRDRGEDGVGATVRSMGDYLYNDWDIEYKYLLDSDGKWYCYETRNRDRELKLLEDILKR